MCGLLNLNKNRDRIKTIIMVRITFSGNGGPIDRKQHKNNIYRLSIIQEVIA